MSSVPRNVVFEATAEKIGIKLEREVGNEPAVCLAAQPAEGSLAARAGIQSGDCILALGAGRPGEGPRPEGVVGQSATWITDKMKAIRASGQPCTVTVQGEGHEHIVEHFMYKDPEATKKEAEAQAKAAARVNEADKSTLPPPAEMDPGKVVADKPKASKGAREQCSAFTSRTCGMSMY